MSYYLSQSPLLQKFIHQMARNNEDKLGKDNILRKCVLKSEISYY